MMKKLAAALVASHRRWHDNQTDGSRELFDAVNEAFVYFAHKE